MLSKKMKSILGLVSLMSIFLIVLTVNENGNRIKDVESVELSSHRGIASTSLSSEGVSESIWKKRLATQIAEFSDLPSAKIARQPSALERLMFGELKGHYLVKLEGSKIGGMILNSQSTAEDLPEYIGNELSFLKKNQDLWVVSFSDLSIKIRDSGKSIISLYDPKKNEVGQAEFVWDSTGHMTSLKVQRK